MSNLPVLWVPPVPPPDPNERPPKRRGGKGVWLAAVAIVALPLLALTVFGEVKSKSEVAPQRVVEAETQKPTPAAPAEAPAASAKSPTALGPSPSTSGGNQPYIAGVPAKAPATPTPPVTPASPAPATPVAASPVPAAPAPAVEAARPAVGPDGRPVRVIGIDRPSADMARGTPAAPSSSPAETAAPATNSAPIVATEPRGTVATPTPVPLPTPAPPQEAAAPTPSTPASPAAPVATESPATPSAPVAATSESPAAAPTVASPPASAPAVPPEAAAAEPVPVPVPAPARRTATAPETQPDGVAKAAPSGDFADRLAAIRRAEARRSIEPPPRGVEPSRVVVDPPPSAKPRSPRPQVVEEDPGVDEEVIVVPRRHWWGGFVPPFFDDGPRRPVLRSYEPPPREAMERAPRGENCHYHLWPTEDMAFHRTVKCHWHRDPEDPSIRYVR